MLLFNISKTNINLKLYMIKCPAIHFGLQAFLCIIFLFYPFNIVLAENENADRKIKLTQEQILDFGSLDAGNGGTISSDCSTTGDVASLGGCSHGRIEIKGEKYSEVTISIISYDTSLSNGSDLAPVSYSIQESPPYILNNQGKLIINVFGVLTVNSHQNSGNYKGNYDVNVEYSDIL